MGKRIGPDDASLFSSYIKAQIFSQLTDPNPELYGHYFDVCIGVTSLFREQLDYFVSFAKYFHLSLEFSSKFSDTYVAFLGIMINIYHLTLTTTIHYKNTDTYSYINLSSSNPTHTKHSMPYSQFLYLCSLSNDY